MLRRSHILTAAALLAMWVSPAYASAKTDAPQVAGSGNEQYQDLRSPDARDAGTADEAPVYQDLRSPDARDAGTVAETQVVQDLRSPDARDAGRPVAPTPDTVVEIREVPSGGFDWGDAGIGAAGILAMLSIAAGLTLMVTGRRRRRGSELPAH